MPPPSSSTSSSEPTATVADATGPSWRSRARGAVAVAAWTVAFLALADGAISAAFRRPTRPTNKPSGASAYFDYGRSTEGKLAYMVRPTDSDSAPLVPIGWVEHGAATPNHRGATKTPRVRVSVYGMSFSNQTSDVLAEVDPAVSVAQYAGPSAPPNHSFALYRQVRRMGPAAVPADVVVWGILASAVKGMATMTGDTANFESPPPFCYPRYTLDAAGQLVERWPSIRTEADLRSALADPARMAAFRDSLAAGDRYYDPICFGGSVLDRSALARMVRRAYADHRVTTINNKIDRPKQGFDPDDPDVGRPLRAMCLDFAATARADGQLPVVLLIQDQGSADHLYNLLGPYLADHGVPVVSTHDLVPTSDRSNFIADGHFTHAAYERVARALLARIDARR